jgi:uncharacterized protein YfdQ (DUF2303 family)
MARLTDNTSAAITPATDPYLPGQALDAAIGAAFLADRTIIGPDGRAHAYVPPGHSLKELPNDSYLPPWVRQRLIVDDRASLTAYAARHRNSNSIIIADYDAGTVSARLDWHPHNDDAAHGSAAADAHTVTLRLRPSEEFTRWDAMEGKLHSQEDFARFLEENSSDVGFPEAATMIEISRDFEATVGQSYKSSVRLDNGDRKLRFESETRALNEVVIPQKFTLNIPVYNGEEPEDLTANFRWRADGSGGVQLGFQWHRVEYQRRARFVQIAATAAEATGLPFYIGRITN